MSKKYLNFWREDKIFIFFSLSRSQTPIRLPYGPNNPPTPHEVAFAQKLLNRIEDMKGKFSVKSISGIF